MNEDIVDRLRKMARVVEDGPGHKTSDIYHLLNAAKEAADVIQKMRGEGK